MSRLSITDQLRAWNTNGTVFLAVGVASLLIAWFAVAPLAIIAGACGYLLYVDADRRAIGAVIGGLGVFGVLLWVVGLLVT